MSAIYVYGLIRADTKIPDVRGIGPSGRVRTIRHGDLAAIVSDIPLDRPLGTRDDLIGHEEVVDAVAATAPVLPMRFPAVVEESGVVEELLAPHHDAFAAALDELAGRTQFTLKGRYVEDAVLRELVGNDDEIRILQARVRELPEDASYYDRIRLGELIVSGLEAVREVDGARILERLAPYVADTALHPPAQPDDVVDVAFLVRQDRRQAFEAAVEDVGKDLRERVRLRLLGPTAPYDFVRVVEQDEGAATEQAAARR